MKKETIEKVKNLISELNRIDHDLVIIQRPKDANVSINTIDNAELQCIKLGDIAPILRKKLEERKEQVQKELHNI